MVTAFLVLTEVMFYSFCTQMMAQLKKEKLIFFHGYVD